ncbi:hypothetical protein DEO72_LG10g1364 [Vigna unguiculata]|uniref:Uncharacterized protein n=1 Tax=Vigna unguiculata TaxID=3917 RepID=A0A4D6NA36_VIGUN|nr:hypothetical protein DEO72_LG10g1364 [Vigna unguiculata]
MSPFSLVKEENQGLEKNGGLTVVETGDGSLRQAWPCSRERIWCRLRLRGTRGGHCLARRKRKREGGRFGDLGSRRRCLRWWLASTVAYLAGHGMYIGNTVLELWCAEMRRKKLPEKGKF